MLRIRRATVTCGEVVLWVHAVRSGLGAVLLGGGRFTGLEESGDFVGIGAVCHQHCSTTRQADRPPRREHPHFDRIPADSIANSGHHRVRSNDHIVSPLGA